MKKTLIFMVILLSLPIALANGLIYHADDFSIKPLQVITIGEKDVLSFNLLNATRNMLVDRVYNDSVTLAIFPDSSNVAYVTIAYDRYARIDVNKDNTVDMLIYLKNIEEKNVTLALKSVSINLTANTNNNTITGSSVVNTPPGGSLGVIVLIILILVVIILGIYFMYFRKVKKKRK